MYRGPSLAPTSRALAPGRRGYLHHRRCQRGNLRYSHTLDRLLAVFKYANGTLGLSLHA